MSVVIEPLWELPNARAFRWSATSPHTAMKESYVVGRLEHGRASFRVRGETFTAEPRSLHVRRPGDVHRDIGLHGPIALTVVSFSPSSLDDELGRVRLEPVLAAGDPRAAPFHRLFDGVAPGLAREVAVAEALAALVSLDGPDVHTRAVRRTLAVLRERVAEQPTLDELAAHAGLDKFRLCRAFRAEVGIPPHAWLTKYRIVRAKELLAAGTAPRDVAPLVGFYDQSRLNRYFKRIVGTTPARWARA